MKEFGYKDLNAIVRGKDVIVVPVVSAIDRISCDWKLDNDGNVNRVIAMFDRVYMERSVNVILPECDEHNIIDRWAERGLAREVTYVKYAHGQHAKDQRVNASEMHKILRRKIRPGNIVFVESQSLAQMLLKDGDVDIVYVLPVSSACGKTRSFTVGYEKIDREIMKGARASVVCGSDQVTEFSDVPNLLFCPVLSNGIDIEVEEGHSAKHVFYLPWRLTDEGYKLDKVIDGINAVKNEFDVVVYTDPNNSMVELPPQWNAVKGSSARGEYYKMLRDPNVTVVYLEDLNFVNHAALWELCDPTARCEVIIDDGVDLGEYGIKNNRFKTYSEWISRRR